MSDKTSAELRELADKADAATDYGYYLELTAALRNAADRIESERAEKLALLALIKKAEHDHYRCNRITHDQYGRPVLREGTCTCWKSQVDTSALDERLAEVWGEGYRYGYPVGFREAEPGAEIETVAPNPYRKNGAAS